VKYRSRLLLRFASAVLVSVFMITCGEDEEKVDACGPGKSVEKNYYAGDFLANNLGVEEGYRKYGIAFTVEPICPYEHIDVYFWVNAYSEFVDGQPVIEGAASWLFLYEERIPVPGPHSCVDNMARWSGTDDVGLAAFGDEPAWCIISLDVGFITKGSEELDNEFMESYFYSAEITVQYHTPKGGTGGTVMQPSSVISIPLPAD